MLLNYDDWDELDEFRWKPKTGFQAGEWSIEERIRRAHPEPIEDEDDEENDDWYDDDAEAYEYDECDDGEEGDCDDE